MIETYHTRHSKEVWNIYKHYVLHSTGTLDHEVPNYDDFKAYCDNIAEAYPFIVYVEDGKVLGYTYASCWKNKAGYNKSLESTIYVHPDHLNKGIGSQLYREFITRLRKLGIKNLVACLTLPNTKSVALHERFGFIKTGHFNAIADKFDQSVDVGYWQLML